MSDRKKNSQLERFKQAAKEPECDQSDDALDKVFKKINPKAEPTTKKPKK